MAWSFQYLWPLTLLHQRYCQRIPRCAAPEIEVVVSERLHSCHEPKTASECTAGYVTTIMWTRCALSRCCFIVTSDEWRRPTTNRSLTSARHGNSADRTVVWCRHCNNTSAVAAAARLHAPLDVTFTLVNCAIHVWYLFMISWLTCYFCEHFGANRQITIIVCIEKKVEEWWTAKMEE